MKTILRSFVLLVCSCCLLSSCHTSYYHPTQQNIPIFREKGEFSGTGSFSTSMGQLPVMSGELSAAYAITDNVFLAGNGAYFSNSEEQGFWGDAGAGYYKLLNEHPNRHWVFEVQGSAGYGKQYYRSSLNLYRTYLQPAFGYRTQYADLAFSMRFTGMYAEDRVRERRRASRTPVLPNPDEPVRYIDYGSHYFVEPAFTFRIGYKSFMFHQQLGLAFPLTRKEINMNPITMSSGITIRLPFRDE